MSGKQHDRAGSAGAAGGAKALRRPNRRLEASHESIVTPIPARPALRAGDVVRRSAAGAAALCVIGVLVLSLHAIRISPAPAEEPWILMVGDPVPDELAREWCANFPPGWEKLYDDPETEAPYDPSTDTIAVFATYLREQDSVAAVRSVKLTHDPETLQRVLAVDLELREPLLPVRLDDGGTRWISGDGKLLHPLIAGPEGLPEVYGIEAAPENLAEVLAAWPTIAEQMSPGFITAIRCDAPQPGGQRFGIKFLTRSGTIIDWGPSGSASYGMDLDKKVKNLIHTVKCQGDMRHVARIDVRFPKPFAVLR